MAAVAVTTNLRVADRIPLGGDLHLQVGEWTFDTGDYATNGIAVTAASLNADTIVWLMVGHSSILGVDPYWVQSALKIKFFKDDIAGVSAEHAASAMTAQTVPFIAIVRKAA